MGLKKLRLLSTLAILSFISGACGGGVEGQRASGYEGISRMSGETCSYTVEPSGVMGESITLDFGYGSAIVLNPDLTGERRFFGTVSKNDIPPGITNTLCPDPVVIFENGTIAECSHTLAEKGDNPSTDSGFVCDLPLVEGEN